jgi:hypothetical protein
MKKYATYMVICLLLLIVNNAKADLMLTAVDGDWSNPVGPGTSITGNVIFDTPATNSVGVLYGNLLQDQIRWGDPANSEKSGLGFTGATSSTIAIGDAFEIGQLAHFNNPIYDGTEIDLADLTITLKFDTGATTSFLYTLGINETPNNTGGSPGDDDIISFPSSYPEERFYISGELYTLQLLGFGSDAGSLLSQFSSPEGLTNDTLLWGRVVQTPVPGAVLLGMLGLGVAGVKLRKYA